MPDPVRHQAFLLNQWQPHKPAIIAFKDPRCPYCVSALKKRHRMDNYNVFLFWAPILGEKSRNDVEELFHCRSPVEPALLERISRGMKVLCSGDYQTKLASLNAEMVASYQPSYVPQYWFGGRSVSFESLQLTSRNSTALQALVESSTLKIPWLRYGEFLVNRPKQGARNLAVVVPDAMKSSHQFETLIARHPQFNWYLFDGQRSTLSSREREFRLLNNLIVTDKPAFVLEGHIMTRQQVTRFIEPDALTVFALSN